MDEIRNGKYLPGARFPSDAQLMRRFMPTLTTAHQPCADLAALACEMLQTRILKRDLPPRATFLDAQLVVRESTRDKTE